MIIRFADIELNDNYNMRSELRKAYGIGFEKANYIGDLLGLGKHFYVKFINRFYEDCLNILVLVNYYLNYRLDSLLKQHYVNMLAIKLRRAIRLSRGLPNRGQRTRSNSKQNRYYLNYKWQDEKEKTSNDLRGSTVKKLKLKPKKKAKKK